MKLEIDIPDDKLRAAVERALTDDNYNWQSRVRDLATTCANARVSELPVERLVHEYIEQKINSILDDVVYKRVKHVVKLAVDKELAVSREVSALNKETT